MDIEINELYTSEVVIKGTNYTETAQLHAHILLEQTRIILK